MSSFPVYKEVADLITEDPEVAKKIDLAQLKTIIDLSKSSGTLLDPETLLKVEKIHEERSKPKPKFKLKALKPLKISFKKKNENEYIPLLNADYKKADSMSTATLEEIIRWSDKNYYIPEDDSEPDMLRDEVYDYVKKVYSLKAGIQDLSKSISSSTGVGAEETRPRKERDTKLPIPLRSLDNVFRGTGDLDKWISGKEKSSFNISAKMDGTSALYYRGKLYTRGDAINGRDITHIIKYLKLPDIPETYAVRGEIVMKKSIFDEKYKDKRGRKVNRNSVSGSIGAISNIDTDFLSHLTFSAYELINMVSDIQLSPSQAFDRLRELSFQCAWNKKLARIDDDILSTEYDNLLLTYDYEIDGIVIQYDIPYKRETQKNPEYAKAYKKTIDSDTAITEIIRIEWNPSQWGLLKPVAVYNPVLINGVTLERATLHNAQEVVKLGIGPGAKVEVIYWGKVNPRIHRVIEKVEPDLPKIEYEWVKNDGIPSDIKIVDGMRDEIQIKLIHKFLEEIGAKGIGETTVKKIYNVGYKTINQFFNIDVNDILFLGPRQSQKIIESINNALLTITVPQLMTGSKVFGRGMGTKKFNSIIRENPDIIITQMSRQEYIEIFIKIDGFGRKTAEQVADGMEKYWEFIGEIPDDIYSIIIENTIGFLEEKPKDSKSKAQIDGKKICLTGFRDGEISKFIEDNGGKIQSSCNGSTTILLRSDDSYVNKKTEFAQEHNIRIMNRDEFINEFMSTYT